MPRFRAPWASQERASYHPDGNARNGTSKKTLKGEFGELPIEISRDRQGNFEPQLTPEHQTRWACFDDKILSLYASGMTVREIQSHLEEMYGAEVSPALISSDSAAQAPGALPLGGTDGPNLRSVPFFVPPVWWADANHRLHHAQR